MIGIVSRRDVRAIVNRRGKESIRAIMTPSPITADESFTMEDALETMYTNKVERLPVTDGGGHLIGIITMQDVLEKRQYPRAVRDRDGNLRVAAAVGPFDHDRAMALVEAGADALVVDCAHGHNLAVVKAVGEIKGSVEIDVVAGNIATSAAAEALVGTVDGLKVGIGPGSICTTRIVAGVGVPQISAIAAVADVAGPADVPVCADGGVRFSGDIAKAIAAGADSVMLGSLFAGTDESPGRIVAIKGRRYKQYRGMGSLGVMTGGQSSDRYFQKKEIGRTKFVPEGVEGVTPYIGRASDAIYQLVGGLRSSMGYTGSATIADLRYGGPLRPDHGGRRRREPPAQHPDHGRGPELPDVRTIIILSLPDRSLLTMLEHDDLARFLDLLGNRNRRRILDLLRHKPCYVTEISDRLVLSPKVVIEHLALLERESLIGFSLDERRRKNYFLYRELDVSIAVRVTPDGRPAIPPPGQASRIVRRLGQFRALIETREGLLEHLDGVDGEIDRAVTELIKSGEGVIENEADVDILLALSPGAQAVEALPELTGLPADELSDRLARLERLGVVRAEGSQYRLSGADAE